MRIGRQMRERRWFGNMAAKEPYKYRDIIFLGTYTMDKRVAGRYIQAWLLVIMV